MSQVVSVRLRPILLWALFVYCGLQLRVWWRRRRDEKQRERGTSRHAGRGQGADSMRFEDASLRGAPARRATSARPSDEPRRPAEQSAAIERRTAAGDRRATAGERRTAPAERRSGAMPRLWEAAERGDALEVDQLLRAGLRVDEAHKGWTPLMKAAEEGHCEVLATLINARANLEAANAKGRTPLSFAAAPSMGRQPILAAVELLLEAGAAVAHKDVRGETARARAARDGFDDSVAAIDAFVALRAARAAGAAACAAAAGVEETGVLTAAADAPALTTTP